jgi:hypothetical protein
MANTIDTQKKPIEMLDAGIARPWPVRILTILLFIQAAGLIGLSVFSYNPEILRQEDEVRAILTFLTEIPRTLAFGSLGLLAIAAGLGFLWIWRTGWPTAMLVQGLGLLVSIGLYLRSNPPYIFGVMAYCIIMVIYLHHPEVQQAFQTKQMQTSEWSESDLEDMV